MGEGWFSGLLLCLDSKHIGFGFISNLCMYSLRDDTRYYQGRGEEGFRYSQQSLQIPRLKECLSSDCAFNVFRD